MLLRTSTWSSSSSTSLFPTCLCSSSVTPFWSHPGISRLHWGGLLHIYLAPFLCLQALRHSPYLWVSQHPLAVMSASQEHGRYLVELIGAVATDIVPSLLRYYHFKFIYLILLSKPIEGAVVNA